MKRAGGRLLWHTSTQWRASLPQSQTPTPLSQFVLHTPSDKAAKNWISQGYTAERGVVIADLVIGGESHGSHASFRCDAE